MHQILLHMLTNCLNSHLMNNRTTKIRHYHKQISNLEIWKKLLNYLTSYWWDKYNMSFGPSYHIIHHTLCHVNTAKVVCIHHNLKSQYQVIKIVLVFLWTSISEVFDGLLYLEIGCIHVHKSSTWSKTSTVDEYINWAIAFTSLENKYFGLL